MLTFSRKENESIIIFTPNGDEIQIRVHGFENNHIKISVDATQDYVIAREELLSEPIF